jgi:hypothetical protein
MYAHMSKLINNNKKRKPKYKLNDWGLAQLVEHLSNICEAQTATK